MKNYLCMFKAPTDPRYARRLLNDLPTIIDGLSAGCDVSKLTDDECVKLAAHILERLSELPIVEKPKA